MRIAVLGAGYVGLVTGLSFARRGHTVCFIDPHAARIEHLRAGRSPIFEPGLEPLLKALTAQHRVEFSTDIGRLRAPCDFFIIAVGTAVATSAGVTEDLDNIRAAIRTVVRSLTHPTTLVIKSTVPVGFTSQMLAEIREVDTASYCSIAMNPEFLREGSALYDFEHPDRIVIGTDDILARDQLRTLYAPWTERGVPLVETTPEGAESIKHAANAFLAVKISFINEMAQLCERTGAPIQDVARGIGLDPRIGSAFLQPGPGFGGSCLPKDLVSCIEGAAQLGVAMPLLSAAWAVNQHQPERAVAVMRHLLDGVVRQKTVAVLGLAFKAGTADLRASPGLAIVEHLARAGAIVRVHDPIVAPDGVTVPEAVTWCSTALAACAHADLVCLTTGGAEYVDLPWPLLVANLRAPILVDLRHALSDPLIRSLGVRHWRPGLPLPTVSSKSEPQRDPASVPAATARAAVFGL